MPLYHTVVDTLRINPSGFTPPGQGVVWDGGQAPRTMKWRNGFCPYLWLGGAERGLAWFGENDRGWITEKGGKTPVQELIREGGVLTLRVYLINIPTTLTQPTRLVYGLQASPTKPLPDNWRLRLPDFTTGLAVVPWGGLNCSYLGPLDDDWQIVDKILELRYGKPFDQAWFTKYDTEHKPPLVFGNWSWLSSVGHLPGRVTGRAGKPVIVYQEEMAPPWLETGLEGIPIANGAPASPRKIR